MGEICEEMVEHFLKRDSLQFWGKHTVPRFITIQCTKNDTETCFEWDMLEHLEASGCGT
jgi:hypothetical protein